MELNFEQKFIFDRAMDGLNLFITGGAGTGKSYLLRVIINSMKRKGLNVLVGAPTGMAAQNLKGVTLHQLFSLGPGICENLPVNDENIESLMSHKAYEILKTANVLVIDEISICRADYFSRIARILEYEKEHGHHIQFIVCGDFFQLPPVVKPWEKPHFTKLNNPEGWPFMTDEWKKLNFRVHFLETVMRQENPEFVYALNQVREGDPSGLEYIVLHATGTGQPSTTVCGTNKMADLINTRELHDLGNPIEDFKAIVVYKSSQDVDVRKEISNITDKVIHICDGARVIITMNDPEKNRYHKGNTGTVISHTNSSVTVLLDRTQRRVEVKAYNYQVYGYDIVWDEKQQQNILKRKVIFVFLQIPVQLGWAVTVHKSQGQTYESMTLETDSLWKVDGLLYVALSRVTDTRGLKLIGAGQDLELLKKNLKTSEAVKSFYTSQKYIRYYYE